MSFLKNLFGGADKVTTSAEQQAVASAVEPEPAHSNKMPDSEADNQVEQVSPLTITAQQIHINKPFTSKEQVLDCIAQTMLAQGLVSDNYLEALMARESKVSTYLINGVAIPHGVNEAKSLVKQTGVVIVQVPKGIVWNANGDVAKLFVGIAAAGDEHLSLLQKLTEVVMDEGLAEQLATTADANHIIQALGGQSQSTTQLEEDFSIQATATVVDEAGMHARPASLLSEHAMEYPNTEIRLRNANRSSNAKSMAGLLAMGAKLGDSLVVSAQGEQAHDAVEALAKMITAGLDTESDNQHATYNPLAGLAPMPSPAGHLVLQGLAASPGIAYAEIVILREHKFTFTKEGTDAAHELSELKRALEQAANELEILQQKLMQKAPSEAAIIKAQTLLLRDETILQSSHDLIYQGCSAPWGWQQALDSQIDYLSTVEDERLRARMADLKDIRDRVIRLLQPQQNDVVFPDHDFILLARDLTPSQTAGLEGRPIKGIATELGGPNSHMAILARALGIPAVVGIGDGALCQLAQETTAVIDAQGACLVVGPDQPTEQQAKVWINTWQEIQQAQAAQQHEPATTLDGRRIEVVCNIAKPQDASAIVAHGGEGAGLLRTEFLFESSEQEPTVEQQIEAFKAIVAELPGKPLVVRTADIGGDKPVSWLDMPHEDNPFLGVRGVRLSFKHPDMFKRQLEAIYRTAKWQKEQTGACGLHIMFPMIAKMSEWQRASSIAESVRQQWNAPVLPLGIMVEVPSAALVADNLAKYVDFFSIGSNDLTQYTLAMDRLNPELCHAADSYHPGLLRLIEMTVKAADANGKWVGVCGNMAADPNIACLLVGLGVHELSVSPANVPAVKNIIRSVSFTKLQAKAQRALSMCSSEAVMAMYQNHDDLI
ncbi:phosphoenolpyruvate--protein phosphotransferase [Motilimonas cestriensis]|uniref:phosphoenolpyruvate--protein phosphotransferase n=1 Tax=Motilimonas cestriensis TaxID=2742685 RepID=A0ABS8WGS8_9GAMM|nr:phosphoenolpyruvate--protein phosphotransferase [Motilimonas cestriensis]MCE2596831.1 phosphoenolpyruvate--protein phosphotransferase [Motilimonas cestriensis]